MANKYKTMEQEKIEPMTRADEREQAADQYAWCNSHLRMNSVTCSRASLSTPIEELRMIPIGDITKQAFYSGAAWADKHPDHKEILSEQAAEREVAFCDAWLAENKQFPTFGHAIEWADRTMVERAIGFIEDAVCDGTIETGNVTRLIENFREAMKV